MKRIVYLPKLFKWEANNQNQLLIMKRQTQVGRYDEARNRPFNKSSREYPLIIFRPKNTEEVSKIVKFYNQHIGIEIPLCIMWWTWSNV